MRPSDATMESAMLRRRFIQYEDHDPFFQTAVNRRGATWSETDVRKLRKVKSYKIKRSEAETKRLKALKIKVRHSFRNLSRLASLASFLQPSFRRINGNTHMNTRVRLTLLATVFALITPTTSALHAQVLAALASMTLNPATLTGGANSTGTVTLSAAAPAGGAVVTLTSSNTNAATVPASVTVAAGATTATFTVVTKTVTVGTVAIITSTYAGISKAVGLVVNPLLGSLTLNPSVLIGGAGSTGTVTLTSAAPAGGAVV
ncbi:MAG: hypothetical protein DME58_00020, partial [Verrucomicrobia bacterium]